MKGFHLQELYGPRAGGVGVRREIGFAGCLAGILDHSVYHAHKGFVERFVLGTGGLAIIDVTLVMELKRLVGLDLLDHRSPPGLPIVGDEQDVLHEMLYVDENSIIIEILTGGRLVPVVVAGVFFKTINVGFLVLLDGWPSDEWHRASGIDRIAFWSLVFMLCGDRNTGARLMIFSRK